MSRARCPSILRDRQEPHGGLFLRLSGGFGYASTEIQDVYIPFPFDAVGDLQYKDVSGDLNFAIGGVVGKNLALHGTLWGWAMADPDVEFLGFEGESNETVDMTAVGGGVTYYFMPVNMYLSGSLGPAWLTIEDSDSDTGFAVDLTLGKEWWVGNSWGLGLAGSFGYHSIPDETVDENWSGTSLGLRFSATLN
jgi:hypothetical protein